MTGEEIQRIQNILVSSATDLGLKLVAAIVFWVVGRFLIGLVERLVRKGLQRQKVDPTVLRYLGSIITITLNVLLVVGILGYFGFQTTTFAALFATAGIAIGAAWAGLLSNFAAGVFLIVLRPFTVGDMVTAGGVTGTVTEIGLFSTVIHTADNVSTLIGNNKIFGDTIQNFSNTPYRRVDLKCQLSGAADHLAAMKLLKEKVAEIQNVLPEPNVEVGVLESNLIGPVLAVRPYCNNQFYWQVYFDANQVIRESLTAAGFPSPMPAQNVFVTQNS